MGMFEKLANKKNCWCFNLTPHFGFILKRIPNCWSLVLFKAQKQCWARAHSLQVMNLEKGQETNYSAVPLCNPLLQKKRSTRCRGRADFNHLCCAPSWAEACTFHLSDTHGTQIIPYIKTFSVTNKLLTIVQKNVVSHRKERKGSEEEGGKEAEEGRRMG